jgi:uncharacterized DUF497 family protein
MGQQFEWDAQKAVANLKKHNVPFDEALTVFGDQLAQILDDPDHSVDERREVIIGHSALQRVLVVGFTERGAKTRIINARSATARERQKYEENTKKIQGH